MARCWAAVLALSILSRLLVATLEGEESSCPADCACLSPQRHVLCRNASLTAIPADVPNGTLELHLEDNRFPDLSTGSFSGLADLSGLYLSSCQIRGVVPGAFDGLSGLTYLHLDNNFLEELEGDIFRNLSSLQYLHLEGNRITSLIPGVFQAMNKLIALYLSNNILTELSDQALSQLTGLRWLDLSGNQLSNISSQAFSGMRNLRKLSLEANNLTRVPSAIRRVTTLQSLKLSRNSIRILSSSSFSRRLRSLTALYLDEVQLEKVTSSAFLGLRQLLVLSLKNNLLETVYLSMFKAQTKLYLSGNPWRCDCNLIWLYVQLQVIKAKQANDGALCSTPPALQGQHLVDVGLQRLTCPAFGTEVTTTTYKADDDETPRDAAPTAERPLPPAANTKSAPTRTTTVPASTKMMPPPTLKPATVASNTVLAKWDPCLADQIRRVEARAKGETSLMVTWAFVSNQDQFEVRYSMEKVVRVLRVSGHLAEVELQQLETGSDYQVCVIPLNKDISKCTAPEAGQCTTGHTAGLPGQVQTVHAPPAPSHSAIGTGVLVAITVLVLVALILAGAYKLRSHQIGFQRHFDEDGPGGERYNPDPYKMDGDAIYETIEEDRNVYVTASSQWVMESEEKLDCHLAAPAAVSSTPRYVSL